MDSSDILTVSEAAELLRISPKTCYEWTHIEGFPCVKVRNVIRIPRTQLLQWFAEQAQKGRHGLGD